MKQRTVVNLGIAAALALAALPTAAQTVKIGFMSTYSGPGAAQGDQLDKGAKLYMNKARRTLHTNTISQAFLSRRNSEHAAREP